MLKKLGLLAGLFLLAVAGLSAQEAHAASALFLNGANLSVWSAIPFVGIILSIAIFPLVAPHFWSKHYGKVALVWAILALGGITLAQGPAVTGHSFFEVMFEQFLPFIFLLVALFTITGGIRISGESAGTPGFNTAVLLIGALLSSWMGTTGAAVLLIRPLLAANERRKFQVHTLIFFIFLVGNIGGSLTPVGNPPLLMGFISKVDFFWPTLALLAPTMLLNGILLVLYFFMDKYFFGKEPEKANIKGDGKLTLKIEGKRNFIYLGLVIGIIVFSAVDLTPVLGNGFDVLDAHLSWAEIVELTLLTLVTILSLTTTAKAVREANHFEWHPIVEVGKLFAGIFICMAPLIAMLRAGVDGPMAFLINSLSDPNTHAPVNAVYYWLAGGLSAFLDSAPAYLVFFNTAAAGHGDVVQAAQFMMNPAGGAATLVAITAGASFMGAITYIGNAPNMMVKAIAESRGIKMPSFFGYMVWSVLILVPLFLLVQFLFIK